ncbi:MAG: ATP-binding protein [Bacteroidales bacterium]|nr:ATP-binding protein [Bacteroidales bacterium]
MVMATNTFRRKIYDRLLKWRKERSGQSAILIQGARRVGKSTIVEQFAKQEYQSHILIDFSKCSQEVFNLFNDISDLNHLFVRLQLAYGVSLHERNSVIVFDEVQKQPLARQAIKHLVADGRYDYIETGSLISIRKNVKDIIIPSEETRVNMYPMDYEEFRWALGDMATIPLLRSMSENPVSLGDAAHRKLLRDFRLYMLVGGMPQAVIKYLETNNLAEVDNTKREILDLYDGDFMKIDDSGKLSMLFNAIPAELNKNASRYQVSSVIENGKADRLMEYIADLRESMTVNMAYHVDDPNAGMSFYKDLNRYKMFLADTGLFVTLAFRDKDFPENVIYQKLWNDKLSTNLGYLYENVVAQMLRTAGNELFYHTFPTEKGNRNYEIDFLLARKNKVCPIEVKSSGYSTHASLDAFCNKYPNRILNRYLLYSKDIKKDKGVQYLPFYMTMFL